MIAFPSTRTARALLLALATLLAPPSTPAQGIALDAGAPLMVVGNDVWLPGTTYKAGEGWFALACDPSGCALEPARLTVKRANWQGHYDDQPTAGQTLTFARLAKNARQPVAWLLPRAPRPWLHAGPVTTWASIAAGFRRADGPGTLELAVPTPPGAGPVRFVPLFDRANQAFTLQLRDGARRQRLGTMSNCSHTLSTNYLLWAGDLDGDGRGDYLVTYLDAEGEVVLYLSGLAAPDAIVGAEAASEALPYDGECDGAGWLE